MPAHMRGLPSSSADRFAQPGVGRQAVASATHIPLAVGADEVLLLLHLFELELGLEFGGVDV